MTSLCVFNQHFRDYIFGANTFPTNIQGNNIDGSYHLKPLESLPKILCIVNLYGVNDRKVLYDNWWNGKYIIEEYIGLENGCFEYDKLTPNNSAAPCDLCGK